MDETLTLTLTKRQAMILRYLVECRHPHDVPQDEIDEVYELIENMKA